MSAANRIYDVLVEECGASNADRDYFVQWHAAADGDEFRFQGTLGFGGKFWANRWSVNCYREDETPARLATMGRANARLAEIRDNESDEDGVHLRLLLRADITQAEAEFEKADHALLDLLHADCMPGWCVLPPSDPRHENHPAPIHGDTA
jgi:hypothetical protein